jgi:hypothetical protein
MFSLRSPGWRPHWCKMGKDVTSTCRTGTHLIFKSIPAVVKHNVSTGCESCLRPTFRYRFVTRIRVGCSRHKRELLGVKCASQVT